MPLAAQFLQGDARAAHLASFVRGVAGAAGMEQSVKASRAGVEADRILLSWAATGTEQEFLPGLFDELGMPDAARHEVGGELRSGAFFHLGYEGGAVPRMKFYSERKPAARGRLPLPLYTAWKWRVGAHGPAGVDEYWLGNATALGAAEAMIADAFADQCAALEAEVLALLRQCAADGKVPMLFDVRRRGGIRHSFDMRCYGTGLRVADAGALVAAADATFDGGGALATALDACRHAELGHVSGGINADGLPFVTVYFGARALA